jgi:azurin
MKNYLLLPVLAGSLLLAGCGQKDQAAASAPAASGAPAATAVASFEITANDAMKFNLTRIEVKAGQEVKITLTNIGSIPKAAMAHNLVVLKKGADGKAYCDAAVTAAATDYIPAALADQVIAHTKMLGPKQSEELVFKAPAEPGEYPFVCTFPAHYLAGMKGVMVVQ